MKVNRLKPVVRLMSLPAKMMKKSPEDMGSDKQLEGKVVLLGVTGSVAATKVAEIVAELEQQNKGPELHIRVVATAVAAKYFMDSSWPFEVLTDESEWSVWRKMGDPVKHIELRKDASVFAIAPLDANTLAKLANGLCDNLLTCVARAWDFRKPFLVFPAMNTMMWEHPVTAEQTAVLKKWGIDVIEPVEKKLACGDIGLGGLPPPTEVARLILSHLERSED